jgi:hypothetical protein
MSSLADQQPQAGNPLKEQPDFEITSEEQARNWILELVEGVEQARRDCNVTFPGDQAATVRFQKRAYTTWMIRHGAALGTLLALYRCRRLNDLAYSELRARVMQTMLPTVTGKT